MKWVLLFAGHGYYNRIFFNFGGELTGDYATGISTNFEKSVDVSEPPINNSYVALSDMYLDGCRSMFFSVCHSAENDDGLGLA